MPDERPQQRPKLPSLFAHEDRLATLERCERDYQFRDKPQIMRELGNVQRRLAELEQPQYREEQSSVTDLSIHPSRLRLSFRNVSGWAVVAVVAIVAAAVAAVLAR